MVGIRRALALLLFSFFFWQFLLTALLGPDEIFACFVGLAACYGLAFFGLAADWFWARWFATGLSHFGSLVLLAILQVGPEPTMIIFGGAHLIVALSLMGEGMAARYEHSEATVERWHFQEESLVLMRRAVRSAGTSLPFLILYTLAPQLEVIHILLLAMALVGMAGLLQTRTWGVFVLGIAGVWALGEGLIKHAVSAPVLNESTLDLGSTFLIALPNVALLAGTLLFVPLIWRKAIARFLRASNL